MDRLGLLGVLLVVVGCGYPFDDPDPAPIRYKATVWANGKIITEHFTNKPRVRFCNGGLFTEYTTQELRLETGEYITYPAQAVVITFERHQ